MLLAGGWISHRLSREWRLRCHPQLLYHHPPINTRDSYTNIIPNSVTTFILQPSRSGHSAELFSTGGRCSYAAEGEVQPRRKLPYSMKLILD